MTVSIIIAIDIQICFVYIYCLLIKMSAPFASCRDVRLNIRSFISGRSSQVYSTIVYMRARSCVFNAISANIACL